MTTIKASEARNNFNEVLNRVRFGKERLVITHHNQVAVVMISPEDYAKLQALEQAQNYNFDDLVGQLEWSGDALDQQKVLRDEW